MLQSADRHQVLPWMCIHGSSLFATSSSTSLLPSTSGVIHYQQGQLGANEQEILCIIERSERLDTAATRPLPISGSHSYCLSSCPQRSSWDTHLPSPSRTGLIRSAVTTKYTHASSHANVTALTTYQEASRIPSNHLGRMADF